MSEFNSVVWLLHLQKRLQDPKYRSDTTAKQTAKGAKAPMTCVLPHGAGGVPHTSVTRCGCHTSGCRGTRAAFCCTTCLEKEGCFRSRHAECRRPLHVRPGFRVPAPVPSGDTCSASSTPSGRSGWCRCSRVSRQRTSRRERAAP